MIEIGKKYRTRSGNKVTVFSTNLNSDRPVAAVVHKKIDILFAFLKDGKVLSDVDGADDLIEVSPYEDFKIDDKVLVWDNNLVNGKARGHFAGVSASGKPMTYPAGKTSFTYNNKYDVLTMWNYCEKADET